MKTKLLVSAAVCALALSSVNTYAGNNNHSYGKDFKQVNIKQLVTKFDNKGFNIKGFKAPKGKDCNTPPPCKGGNCGAVPEIDASSSTLAFGLTAGLIALVRGRRRRQVGLAAT